jgi:signal transduction histidine kinase
VTSLKGYTQLLQRALARGQLDHDRLARALESLDETADRLTMLSNDLLDIARIRLGRLPLRLERLDLAPLIRDVADRYRDRLEERHTLTLDLAATEAVILGDRDRLDQVLTNLIDNAIKYSPAGGAVRLVLVVQDQGYLLTVEDHGIGIPLAAIEQIFEPFARAPNAAHHHVPGMGLGLAICRNIVERHGGHIWATSDGEACGTTLWLWLPPADAARAAEHRPAGGS